MTAALTAVATELPAAGRPADPGDLVGCLWFWAPAATVTFAELSDPAAVRALLARARAEVGPERVARWRVAASAVPAGADLLLDCVRTAVRRASAVPA